MPARRVSETDSHSDQAGGAKKVLGVALTGVLVLFVLAYRRFKRRLFD